MPAAESVDGWGFRRWLQLIGIRHAYRVPVSPADRRRVIAGLFPPDSQASGYLRRFATLTALSVGISALGIMADSTAVVIGAMLIAPLLGPVLGVAAALVMGWPRRIATQIGRIAVAAAGSVALAYGISLLVPGQSAVLPGELLARTSPNLLDLGIALAAGAAGAYGLVRREAGDAIPGVAIAVALVPPLSTVGIALQLGEMQLAVGALLLFAANISGIVFSGAVALILAGFVPGQRLLSGNVRIAVGLRWAALAVIVVVIPIQVGRGQILPPVDQTEEVAVAIHEFFGKSMSEVEIVRVTVDAGPEPTGIDVVVTSPFEPPPVQELARFLAAELRRPVEVRLQVVESSHSQATVTDPVPLGAPQKAVAGLTGSGTVFPPG